MEVISVLITVWKKLHQCRYCQNIFKLIQSNSFNETCKGMYGKKHPIGEIT